jgi:MEMO1 family protein
MDELSTYHDEERQPAVAGTFYPNDPLDLSKKLSGYLAGCKRNIFADNIQAIIAPHAGYEYSGMVAASAYKELEGLKYDNVVVISPSHTTFFQGASVFNGAAYITPLGKLFINSELCEKIGTINDQKVYLSNKGHTGGGNRQEHALEVQLPFLQMVLGDFKLIPIVMGEQEWDIITALSDYLASALAGTNTLIVASSDLSHFYSSQQAIIKDSIVRNRIEEFNAEGLYNAIAKGQAEACGCGPMAAAMLAARKLGANRVNVTDYADSGKVTGDTQEVVGYLAAVIYKD